MAHVFVDCFDVKSLLRGTSIRISPSSATQIGARYGSPIVATNGLTTWFGTATFFSTDAVQIARDVVEVSSCLTLPSGLQQSLFAEAMLFNGLARLSERSATSMTFLADHLLDDHEATQLLSALRGAPVCVGLQVRWTKSRTLSCVEINGASAPPSSPQDIFTVSKSTQVHCLVAPSPDVCTLPSVIDMETAAEEAVTFSADPSWSMVAEMLELPLRYSQLFEERGLRCPAGILLTGPPGVGKTHLVRTVARHFKAKVFSINAAEIASAFAGEAERALREVFETARRTGGSKIVFIDEIEAMCPNRNETSLSSSRLVGQLLTLMDGIESRGHLLVIGATNLPNQLEPALRRPGRFDRELRIDPPDVQRRIELLRTLTVRMPLAADVDLGVIASECVGYVAADLSALSRSAALLAVQQDSNSVTHAHFITAMKTVGASVHREYQVERPRIFFSQIGGLEDVKHKLTESVIWPLIHPESCQRLGVSMPKGILLYGPPGCGKTTLVKAVATECNASFLSMSVAQIYSPYLGETEKGIRELFSRARAARPAIIFLDEIDGLVSKRGSNAAKEGSGVEERVLSTLLNEMDGVDAAKDILVLAASNRPQLLDEALMRPGRFDRIIFVPVPDSKSRKQIIELQLSQIPTDRDVNVEDFIAKTEGYTGADLENVCREASLIALRESLHECVLHARHIDAALLTRRATPTAEYTINAQQHSTFS